jgi:hypothetical protein
LKLIKCLRTIHDADYWTGWCDVIHLSPMITPGQTHQNICHITGVSETLESVRSSNSRLKCTEHDMHRAADVRPVPDSWVSDTPVTCL